MFTKACFALFVLAATISGTDACAKRKNVFGDRSLTGKCCMGQSCMGCSPCRDDPLYKSAAPAPAVDATANAAGTAVDASANAVGTAVAATANAAGTATNEPQRNLFGMITQRNLWAPQRNLGTAVDATANAAGTATNEPQRKLCVISIFCV